MVFGILLATLAPLALVASNKVDREFLDALLRTHSVTGDRKGIYQGVDLVRGWLEKRGVYCRTETNAVGLVGLYASVTRTHTPDYLFVSHIDVVPGPEFLFTPRVEGDRFFARGACDTKGNVVAICQTLANLVGTGASVGVVLATDEEGGRGATATAQLMIDKGYVGKNILYLNVFKRNDLRTIYNLVYQDGKGGPVLMKRFAVTSLTRDREYDMTRGTKGSKIWWFSANPNGEAEILRVTLKEKPRLKKLQFDVDFADIAVKGKGAIGNLVTRNDVHRISLKERGTSTLGGREVWFDPDVLRLNYDGRGFSLGEFFGNDLVLVVLKNGQFYTSTFDATNHYEDNILFIEKFRPKVVWTAVLNDADQGYPYIKRFAFEATAKKQSFIGENADSQLLLISDKKYPRFRVVFGGVDEFREPLVVDAVDYIGEKSFKAKGKRLTTYTVGNIEEIEPREVPEEEVEAVPEVDIEPAKVVKSDDIINQNDVRDELTGQMRLFEDEI